MMSTVLSLVDLASREEQSFFDIPDAELVGSCDSNNCGSCDSRGC